MTVTAETEDGKKAAVCQVALHFQAEAVEADREKEDFEIILTRKGRRSNPVLTWSGTEGKQVAAAVYTAQGQKKPVWTSSDPSILTVTEGGMAVPAAVNEDGSVSAEWIREAHGYMGFFGVYDTRRQRRQTRRLSPQARMGQWPIGSA